MRHAEIVTDQREQVGEGEDYTGTDGVKEERSYRNVLIKDHHD